jgi:hypothetical protein
MSKYTEPGGPRWYTSPNAPIVLAAVIAFIAWGFWIAIQDFNAAAG